MSVILIDSSAIVPILLLDECGEYSQTLVEEAFHGHELISLMLCRVEVGNALLQATRRERLTVEEAEHSLATFEDLPIEFQETLAAPQLTDVYHLASAHQLSFYDAAFLHAAKHRADLLATLDDRLRQAAQNEGISLYEPS